MVTPKHTMLHLKHYAYIAQQSHQIKVKTNFSKMEL